jgi:hypothetical protein
VTEALEHLRTIERTEFFSFVRGNTVLTLYNLPEVWAALGYEGASVEKGGYLTRGFDDLDWLPEPRVEEYSGELSRVETGPLPYAVTAGPIGTSSIAAGPTAPGPTASPEAGFTEPDEVTL